MAEELIKTREVKRQKLVQKYAKCHAELEAVGDYKSLQKLQILPRNSLPARLHNHCKIVGRLKGYMRQFSISHTQSREVTSAGLTLGVKKVSW